MKAVHLDDRELTRLARDVPWRDLDAREVDRVRANLLDAAKLAPPRVSSKRRVVSLLIASLAVAAVLAAIALREVPAPVPARAIIDGEGASFTHDVTASGEEVVRVARGRVRIRAPQHLRVVVGDAQLELDPTELELFVENDQLVSVWSETSPVEILRFGRPPILVRAGDRWQRAEVTPEAPRPPAPKPRKAVRSAKREAPPPPVIEAPQPVLHPETATVTETPAVEAAPEEPAPGDAPRFTPEQIRETRDELAFREGWLLYRAGSYPAAAKELAKVDPRGPWGEDADYWRAKSILQGKDDHASIAALREFLARHPRAARAGDVKVTLGWLLLRAGRGLEARRLFRECAGDPSVDVRESARRGYEEAEDD